MLQVKKEGILLKKTDLGFESEGVLNPGAIYYQDFIHIFYRAVAPGNYSTIGYCKLSDHLLIVERRTTPLLFPQFDYEKQGLEDARIVCIENVFYLTYTAYDGINALGALATSTDLIDWKKQGIIVPQMTYEEFHHFTSSKGPLHDKYERYNAFKSSAENNDKKVFVWDKNLVFFPRKIDGNFCFLHRIKPDIQIVVQVKDLAELTIEFWQHYFLSFEEHIVLKPRFTHEASYIGSGCPPIETPEGWLVIYHGVYDTVKGYIYTVCALLLDLEHPEKEIARLPYPLFFPEKEWELKGEVNNVCFPTGAVVLKDTLYIFYGAADERIAVATLNKTELMNELLLNRIK